MEGGKKQKQKTSEGASSRVDAGRARGNLSMSLDHVIVASATTTAPRVYRVLGCVCFLACVIFFYSIRPCLAMACLVWSRIILHGTVQYGIAAGCFPLPCHAQCLLASAQPVPAYPLLRGISFGGRCCLANPPFGLGRMRCLNWTECWA